MCDDEDESEKEKERESYAYERGPQLTSAPANIAEPGIEAAAAAAAS